MRLSETVASSAPSSRLLLWVVRCPSELGLSTDSPVEVEVVEEGAEPADFWTALGTMDRKAYDCMLQGGTAQGCLFTSANVQPKTNANSSFLSLSDPGKYNFTPRLFHLSACSGSFRAKELQSPYRLPGLVMAMPFVQESLYSVPQPGESRRRTGLFRQLSSSGLVHPPALFLLDNRLEVYLWQRGQPEQTESSASAWSRWHNERRCAMQTALQYCKGRSKVMKGDKKVLLGVV